MPHRLSHWFAVCFALICMMCLSARGQSMARVAQNDWNASDYAIMNGNPIFEVGGHVAGTDRNDNTQVQWSDNWGAVRLDNANQDSPFVAYRFLVGQMNTNTPQIRSTMDDVELGAGLHVGTLAGWKISTILGAGYDSTQPFVNEKGIFGIGDITAVRAIDNQNSFLLAVDYNGNNAFLPDVPLPGFAFLHHSQQLDFTLGYPDCKVEYRPVDKVKFLAAYSVPYTARVTAEYLPWEHFGVYGSAGNTMQGVVLAKQDSIDRQFFQMRRAELGLRVIFTPYVDAGVGIGYAFDQVFSEGYDVRSLRSITHISNEPYLSLVLHGKF